LIAEKTVNQEILAFHWAQINLFWMLCLKLANTSHEMALEAVQKVTG